jgi:adenylate kinase
MKLDAVIEFVVDESAMLARVEKRAAETLAAGGTPRPDDNAEAMKTRLAAYRVQTAPLSGYYRKTGELRTVDGMKSIDEVSAAIDVILAAANTGG